MSTQREGVNPLRPYYVPPTIGETTDPFPKSLSHARNATTAGATRGGGGAPYASKARDILHDVDYKDFLGDSSPSVMQSAKEFVDDLVWKYMSVLMAQPFEVAKTILQVRDQDEEAVLSPSIEPETLQRHVSSQPGAIYDDSDSEGDEPAYFTSNVPSTPTPSYNKSLSRGRIPSPLQSPRPATTKKAFIPEHFINLRRPDSVLDVIGQLWQREGAWGVWKGTNATFLYTVLQSLLENWSRSFLSAILNVPDLGVKDDMDRLVDIASPYPWVSLFVAATAAVVTGVALSPLDLVRTRLIVALGSKTNRRTLSTLRALPSYVCPSAIAIPTVLHSLVHPLLTLSTPLALRSRFLVDSQASPVTFSMGKFFASSAAILIKLPLETVLRRGQMAVLATQEYMEALGCKDQKLETIVPVGRYYGAVATMYHITTEEGSREMPAKPSTSKKGKGKTKAIHTTYRKGQGLPGLWRGWKVNWWGLVGLWVAGIVGNGGEGEF